MAYLFDTDAISEVLKKKPAPLYMQWLQAIPPEQQYVSAITVGELYKGAYRKVTTQPQILQNLQERILPGVLLLPFDRETAQIYGHTYAELERQGQPLAHADLQIAATAIQHGLELVTGNLRHFERVPGLQIQPILSLARQQRADG